MKSKLFNLATLSLAVSIGLSSCEKETDNEGGDYFFEVKIDGVDYVSDLGDAATAGWSHSNTVLTIKDKAGNQPGFFINVRDYSGPKTYPFNSNASNASYSEKVNENVWNFWGTTDTIPGEITLTSVQNNVAEGTFFFEGYNPETNTTKKFTEGKFRVKIQS